MIPPAWLPTLALAAAMLGAFAVGWRLRTRWRRMGEALPELYPATLAILGLLLAFTFSEALTQHYHRRDRAVEDANAIGKLYTCASLLDEPLRGRLQALVRRYLEQRVSVGHAHDKSAALARELPIMSEMQSEMKQLVREAATQRSPITVPLVNSLNEVMSSHGARLAALRHRLPWEILLLLALSAIVCMLVVGTEHPAVGSPNLVLISGFVVLVSLVVWVTLDLNHPGTGIISVSQEPLERLLTTMTQ